MLTKSILDARGMGHPLKEVKFLILLCWVSPCNILFRSRNPPNIGDHVGTKSFLSLLDYNWLQNGNHKIHFLYLWRHIEMLEAEKYINLNFGQFEHFLFRVNELRQILSKECLSQYLQASIMCMSMYDCSI